jgi:hypothetical protein
VSARARRSAFASSRAPSCQHDSCQNRPSRKSRDVVSVCPHRAQCLSCVADLSCIAPSDRASVLRLVTAHGSSVRRELPATAATMHWWRVVHSADVSRRGQGVWPPRQTQAVRQKNAWHVVAAHGMGRGLIARFFSPHTPEAQTARRPIVLLDFKRGRCSKGGDRPLAKVHKPLL